MHVARRMADPYYTLQTVTTINAYNFMGNPLSQQVTEHEDSSTRPGGALSDRTSVKVSVLMQPRLS